MPRIARRRRRLTRRWRAGREAISNFLAEVFQSPDPARDGRTITVAEMLDRRQRNWRRSCQINRRVGPDCTWLGKTYSALGLHREAIPLQEKAGWLPLQGCAAGASRNTWSDARTGEFLHGAGRVDEALKLQEEVLTLSRKVNGPEHPDTLSAMHTFASPLRPAAGTRRSRCGRRC